MSAKDIGSCIDLTGRQVIGWANNNGLRKGTSRLFTDQELEFIKNNYLSMTYRQIADHLGYTEDQICGWINHNLPNKNRVFDNHYFDVIDTSDKAYWLGLIYADGWISTHFGSSGTALCSEFGIELQRGDEYLLRLLNEALGGVHKIYQKHHELVIHKNKNKTISDTSILRVYSKQLVSGLQSNGISFNKTKSNIFPVVTDLLFPDFLRGYIDGDGCIHLMRDSVLGVHITGANKEILKYIQRKLKEMYGISTSLYTENDRKYRLYCYRKKDVRHLLSIIYYSSDCLKLDRKYNKYLSFYGLAA